MGIPNNTIRDHVVPTGNPSISVRRVKQLCTIELEIKIECWRPHLGLPHDLVLPKSSWSFRINMYCDNAKYFQRAEKEIAETVNKNNEIIKEFSEQLCFHWHYSVEYHSAGGGV